MLSCPQCEKKVNEELTHCPFCQAALHDEAAKKIYQQRLEQDIAHRKAMNKQNAKVQIIWFVIFAIVIGALLWWKN
ncbi:hypothetical protein QV08_05405 [Gallibacterium salpingitidis]|uniref:Zinc ribbon domain-containing protein n=1 Tax=Gallibacterium salpingitidis TaxID=505341 RepID=A0A1A7P0H7_9PAST|nr:hypothetical protein [Gallibacterium salpingitidis]OBW94744.1 hypothetical protein QS62_05400 [Gallibacterium salpingitidis]OBX08082.1 hypothetical protein QV08_05405 [Gallibacterium salpingitidis]OBX11749.1 hypothetical protein QV09_01560 [Gallibacterium salpingitidis]